MYGYTFPRLFQHPVRSFCTGASSTCLSRQLCRHSRQHILGLSVVRFLTKGGVGALGQVEDGENLALKSHNVLRILDRALVELREGRIEALQKTTYIPQYMPLVVHQHHLFDAAPPTN